MQGSTAMAATTVLLDALIRYQTPASLHIPPSTVVTTGSMPPAIYPKQSNPLPQAHFPRHGRGQPRPGALRCRVR